MKFPACALATLLLFFAAAQSALAHDSRPLVISIEEQASNTFLVSQTPPPSLSERQWPTLQLEGSCTPLQSRTLLSCPDGLTDTALNILYPGSNPSLSTLVRVTWNSGEVRTLLAGPGETEIVLPSPETPSGVAGEYFTLGVEHILEGYDHLLFLACLIFIAGTLRRVVVTVTGFTIAHSITLAAAALDIIRVPVPPVEAVISLSILLLATEIARPRRDTLTWRFPIAIAGLFGLIHGFGFASVLSEIGLPQTETPMALLFFNLGVEAGQLIFVTAFFLVAAITRQLLARSAQGSVSAGGSLFAVAQKVVIYGVGIVAAYWMIERTAGFIT